MSAAEHDDVFAAVSHLPHLLAFALVDMLAGMPHADQYFNYAASGFRDFTRIAAGSPEMWRDISVANRGALREQLSAYRRRLDDFDRWLAKASGEDILAIERVYARAASARRAASAACEPTKSAGAGASPGARTSRPSARRNSSRSVTAAIFSGAPPVGAQPSPSCADARTAAASPTASASPTLAKRLPIAPFTE
jgi:hypothetical protein